MDDQIIKRLGEAFRDTGNNGHLIHVITANHHGWHASLVVRNGRHLVDVVFSGHDDNSMTLPVTDKGYWVDMDLTRASHIGQYEPADNRLEAAAETLLKPNYPHGGRGRYYRLGETPIAEALEAWRQVSKAVNRELRGKSLSEARQWVASGGMDRIYAAVPAPPRTRPIGGPGGTGLD